ncbi:MAG: hypothetical protein BJ554DRAFT_3021, partial [Olpidium bornovanus]
MVLDIRSLIGHRAKVQDIPKVTSLVESRLRSAFDSQLVYPMRRVIPLPSLWTNVDRHLRESAEEEEQQEPPAPAEPVAPSAARGEPGELSAEDDGNASGAAILGNSPQPDSAGAAGAAAVDLDGGRISRDGITADCR